MTIIFLRDCMAGIYYWLEGKRIVAYFLLQNDLIVILLALILLFEIRRWNRIRNR